MSTPTPAVAPPHVILAAVRSLTLANPGRPCPLALVALPAGTPTEDLALATHAILPAGAHNPANAPIDLDLPLPLWSSKAGTGQVTLRSLLVLWVMRTSAFGEYMMNTSTRGGTKAASVTAPERQETLAWLRGEKDGCRLVDQWAAHGAATSAGSVAASVAATGAMSMTATGAYGDAMDVDPHAPSTSSAPHHPEPSRPTGAKDGSETATATSGTGRVVVGHDPHASSAAATAAATSKIVRAADLEYTQRSRLTYLTAPNAKDFSYLVKITHDPLVRGKPAPRPSSGAHGAAHGGLAAPGSSSKSSGHRHGSSSSRSGASSSTASGAASASSAKQDPIILVPPGLNSLLTMYNVRALLEDAKYTPTDQARMHLDRKPTLLEIQRKAADPGPTAGPLGATTASTSGATWKVLVMDSPDRLQTAADWDRVIAVFAGGMAWQFDGWRWNNPVELFTKVRGYHVRMHDEQVPPAVQGWNVKHLVMHRTKRHLDLPVVLEFWTDLERWVRSHKPHLLP